MGNNKTKLEYADSTMLIGDVLKALQEEASEYFKDQLTQTRLNNAKAILKYAVRIEGIYDIDQLSYILATAIHESCLLLVDDHQTNPKNNIKIPEKSEKITADQTKGHGYVQVTSVESYKNFNDVLAKRGIKSDLVNHPSLVRDSKVATIVLVVGMKEGVFRKKKLNDFFNTTSRDFKGARAIITKPKEAVADYIANIALAISEKAKLLGQERVPIYCSIDNNIQQSSTNLVYQPSAIEPTYSSDCTGGALPLVLGGIVFRGGDSPNTEDIIRQLSNSASPKNIRSRKSSN